MTHKMTIDLKSHIREIPDFPVKGILFYDISTLLAHPKAWRYAVDRITENVEPLKPDVLACVEARGFLVAAPLALNLGCGFVMMRKKNKLPGETIGRNYAMEYGMGRLEIRKDAVAPGQKVVVVDDLLATGGTMAAAVNLLQDAGAEVLSAAFIMELSFLEGRRRLPVPCSALISYDH
ncbi:adenine phosphoribosyltransferase [Alphaproteobacteria bacterium]|nr:adenine phosphoribosyltransferase [Alphaproteobacteria bacterium]